MRSANEFSVQRQSHPADLNNTKANMERPKSFIKHDFIDYTTKVEGAHKRTHAFKPVGYKDLSLSHKTDRWWQCNHVHWFTLQQFSVLTINSLTNVFHIHIHWAASKVIAYLCVGFGGKWDFTQGFIMNHLIKNPCNSDAKIITLFIKVGWKEQASLITHSWFLYPEATNHSSPTL